MIFSMPTVQYFFCNILKDYSRYNLMLLLQIQHLIFHCPEKDFSML